MAIGPGPSLRSLDGMPVGSPRKVVLLAEWRVACSSAASLARTHAGQPWFLAVAAGLDGRRRPLVRVVVRFMPQGSLRAIFPVTINHLPVVVRGPSGRDHFMRDVGRSARRAPPGQAAAPGREARSVDGPTPAGDAQLILFRRPEAPARRGS